MTAAFFLRKKGHRVTVFEARPKPGGMLRYGIPDYRLPRDVLDKEIDRVLKVGVELRTGQKLGENLDPLRLREEGYDAVFIAVGAQSSKKIALEGTDEKDVLWGLEFLVRVNEGRQVEVRDRVAVIGGGSVAVDVALTARRLGARNVVMACLENREEMPALPWEIEMAEEEGVEVLTSWGPHRITGGNGTVLGIELSRCVSVFDKDGNFSPVFDDTRKSLDAQQVILAVGQTTDLGFCDDFVFSDDRRAITVKKGLIAADSETQETGVDGVFAGGDTVSGPSTIVEAIAAGRRAANAMDKYLGGRGIIDSSRETAAASYNGDRPRGFADLKRAESPSLAVGERHKGFSEVDLCFDDEHAAYEVNRCLHCDLEYRLAVESTTRTGSEV
jgi:NADPH-dependent glutamate synthase beta subunit-like oxidoreductase